MDVEGYEQQVLNGMLKTLHSDNLDMKLSIATYHNQLDFEQFKLFFENRRFVTQSTQGYILFYYDKTITAPYLRKCILQSKN
jgi:hypothetical protein